MAGSVSVEVIYTETDASLIVRDTGVGIPAAGMIIYEESNCFP
jgi:signal transduction histidine kinase